MRRLVIILIPFLLASCMRATRTGTVGAPRAPNPAVVPSAPKEGAPESPPDPPQERDPPDLQRLGLIASLSVVGVGLAYIGYRKWKSSRPVTPKPTPPETP